MSEVTSVQSRKAQSVPLGASSAKLAGPGPRRSPVRNLLQTAVRHLNERVMFPHRYHFLTAELAPYLVGAESILDIGSSNGRLISALTANLNGCKVTAVDTWVQADAIIPITTYDGRTLPFADNTFDCVVLADVLHHSDDPVALLKEATRVSRRHVLIKDHYYKTQLDWQVLKWADFGGNAPLAISLPCNYLTLTEWDQAIEVCHLEVVAHKAFTNYLFDPCKHVIYHLRKSPSES